MSSSIRIYLLFILTVISFVVKGQDATSFLVGIIESHNQRLNDLDQFISPDATCFINGIESDTNALTTLTENFNFLNAVYTKPQIHIQNLVADKTMAFAEWNFTDSIGELANGMVSIKLENKKISSIKILNGMINERSTGSSNGRGQRRQPGSRIQRGETPQDQSYWYYLRVSHGGFGDLAGVYFSGTLSCDSPGLIPEKFTKEDLNGPFPDRQTATKAMQPRLDALKKSGLTTHPTEASCTN
ncbi:MAG: hypothetical protein ACFHWX_03390 [Bacteroidota bacterium]